MKIYNLVLDRLIKQNIPSPLRFDAWIYAFISSCIEPLKTIYNNFTAFKSDVDFILAYNSQVCFLTGMLNDRFDPDDRFFWIENEPSVEFTMIKRNAEQDFTMMKENDEGDPTVMFRRDKIVYKNSFIVHAPVSLQPIEDKIKQSVNDYKLATRTFKIIYY